MQNLKQILVMRKDLNMRKGKLIAQGAHASLASVLENLNHIRVKEWLLGSFTKIAVSVDSEEELIEIYNKALEKGLITRMIIDSGKTEFNGIPTKTCIAVGPATSEELESVTNHLKLI